MCMQCWLPPNADTIAHCQAGCEWLGAITYNFMSRTSCIHNINNRLLSTINMFPATIKGPLHSPLHSRNPTTC